MSLSSLPAWMWVTVAVGVVLFVPAALYGGWVWIGQRCRWIKLRKRFSWGIFRFNASMKGFTSWAIHLGLFTYNVTNGRLTLNLPGPFFQTWNLKKAGRDARQRDDDVLLDIQWSETYHAHQNGKPLFDGLGKIMAQRARVSGVWIERRRKAGTNGKVLVGGGQEFPLTRLEDAVNAELRVHGGRVVSERRFVPLELNEFEEA